MVSYEELGHRAAERARWEKLVETLVEALQKMRDSAEEMASSDPDMPSHAETEATFDRALLDSDAALSAAREHLTTADPSGQR